MNEFFEIISNGPAKHFVFRTPKEVCDHMAQFHTYKVVESCFSPSENATIIRLDVPALNREVSFHVQKTSRSCENDFAF